MPRPSPQKVQEIIENAEAVNKRAETLIADLLATGVITKKPEHEPIDTKQVIENAQAVNKRAETFIANLTSGN